MSKYIGVTIGPIHETLKKSKSTVYVKLKLSTITFEKVPLKMI